MKNSYSSNAMVTIAHLVKKNVEGNTLLLEGLNKGIISHGSLAEEMHNLIEKDLGKKVKLAAIVMALRRYEEELRGFDKKHKKGLHGEILLRTNVIDINVVKSPSLLGRIRNLYAIVDFEKGDLLNIILGNNEVAIITNEKYKEKLLQFLAHEKILAKETNLVSLTILFHSRDFITTPGVIFNTTRKLAWEGINIYEIVSTANELTFILEGKDSMKAYTVLKELFS